MHVGQFEVLQIHDSGCGRLLHGTLSATGCVRAWSRRCSCVGLARGLWVEGRVGACVADAGGCKGCNWVWVGVGWVAGTAREEALRR